MLNHNRIKTQPLFLIKGLLTGLGIMVGGAVLAAETMHMDMSEHAHHHDLKAAATVKRSMADYKLPALKLVRNDGKTTRFPNEIDDGRPVILDFIYTSCTAVCPLTSQVFSQVQTILSGEHQKVHLVSISIDPEYDTPERLTAYARKFHARSQWQHYTGTIEASIAMQKAFDAYRGDKMNHIPLTFIRSAPGKPWVRLDGFASPDEVVREYRQLAANG